MGRRAAFGLLGLMAVSAGAGAQTLPASETFAAARAQLASGHVAEAAGLFHRALADEGMGRFTLRLAVYCEPANVERSVRASGSPPELFVLRRPLGDRACLALYWGLFASPAAAKAARSSVPASLRASGQSPMAVSAILPAGEPPARVAAAPAPAVEAETRPPDAVVRPRAPAVPAPRTAEPAAAPAPSAAAVGPPVAPAPPPAARPSPVPPSAAATAVRVPAVEVEAGYSALWDDTLPHGGGSGAFEVGGILSGCANLTRGLGIVGEASAHYDSGTTLDALGAPVTLDRDVLGVHAGLRYTHRTGGFALPYVQALAGWTRSGIKLAGQRAVEDDFSFQPGAGLQLRLSSSVGILLGADYRLVTAHPSRNEVRLHAGFVFGIGDR
ncbi:MAG TPA: outer membrane beta-barrel protein [Vicinamibacteria bacterium]|nr:outer membrane beta-barrel protein [Vicinamibacteria bacterium]